MPITADREPYAWLCRLVSEQESRIRQYAMYDDGEEVALIGERASDNNVFSNWATSDLYRVLRQSVLDRLGHESAGPWAVMVGMPVSEFKDEPYRALLTKLWEGEHTTATGTV